MQSMPLIETVEQLFWTRVWRCIHRHPCKKCCWPWMKDTYGDVCCSWSSHGIFYHPTLPQRRAIAAHRFAYILAHGIWILPGIVVRHCCHFGPCCNPSHLCLGSKSDNSRDNRGHQRNGEGYPPIQLPDGTRITRAQTYEADMERIEEYRLCVLASRR